MKLSFMKLSFIERLYTVRAAERDDDDTYTDD